MPRHIAAALALVMMPLPLLAQAPERWPDRDLLRKNEIMKVKRTPASGVLLAPQPTAEPAPLRRRPLHDRRRDQSDDAVSRGKRHGEDHAARGDARLVEIDADDALDDIGRARRRPATRSNGPVRPVSSTIDVPAGVFPGDTIDIEMLYSGSPGSPPNPASSSQRRGLLRSSTP